VRYQGPEQRSRRLPTSYDRIQRSCGTTYRVGLTLHLRGEVVHACPGLCAPADHSIGNVVWTVRGIGARQYPLLHEDRDHGPSSHPRLHIAVPVAFMRGAALARHLKAVDHHCSDVEVAGLGPSAFRGRAWWPPRSASRWPTWTSSGTGPRSRCPPPRPRRRGATGHVAHRPAPQRLVIREGQAHASPTTQRNN